jgi:glycerol-3-phosphate acyltransferase PlsY
MTEILSRYADIFTHTGPHPALIACALAACYFIGNINPAILIGKAYGVDVRSEGSGNAGMTNAMRTIGKRAGVMTFLIDLAKGVLPALVASQFAPAPFAALCGVFVVAGHIWPAVYGFRGGKGVSTCFGVILALSPVLALILLAVVLAGAFISKRVSVGTLLACACAAPAAYLMDPGDMPEILAAVALVVISHRANIARLVRGEEPRMSFGARDARASDETKRQDKQGEQDNG